MAPGSSGFSFSLKDYGTFRQKVALPLERVLVIQPPNFLQSMSRLSFSRAQEACDCLPYISIKQTLSPGADEQMLFLLTSHHVTSETHPEKYLCSSGERHFPCLSWAVQNIPAKREMFLLPFFIGIMQGPGESMAIVSQWSFPLYFPPEIFVHYLSRHR